MLVCSSDHLELIKVQLFTDPLLEKLWQDIRSNFFFFSILMYALLDPPTLPRVSIGLVQCV